jgi:hypothetical protein
MKHDRSRAKTGRRAFLRSSALAGVGAIASPLVLPSRVLGAASPSKRLNIAAIGTGGRCRALMAEILRQGENLVALADTNAIDSERQNQPLLRSFFDYAQLSL